MTTVTIHQAKTNLSKLINLALAGEDVIIARGKAPVVKLEAIKPKAKRKPGTLKGIIGDPDESVFAPMRDEELAEWGLL